MADYIRFTNGICERALKCYFYYYNWILLKTHRKEHCDMLAITDLLSNV